MRKQKVLYVKIVKCSTSTFWYKDHIGLIFPVQHDLDWPQNYKVVDDLAWIEKRDAKRVNIQEKTK